jgi:hypothetical protein
MDGTFMSQSADRPQTRRLLPRASRWVVALVTALVVTNLAAVGSPAAASEVDLATEACLVDRINASRSAEDLQPLTVVADMVPPSRDHTQAMVVAGRLFHASTSQMLSGAPPRWSWVGENVGYARDCARLHTNFMNSPGHEANILKSSANGVAVGAVRSGTSVWVTVRFVASPSIVVSTPSQPFGSFRDVPTTHVFHHDIERLAEHGLTRGCNPPTNDLYCPDAPVTRAQMAAFVARAVGFPRLLDAGFLDVPRTHTFAADIATLAAAGVVKGCDPPTNTRYCPDRALTRAEMATLLSRALALPSAAHAGFTDVPTSHPFAKEVAALAAAGITRGCNPPDNTAFCPDHPITRAEMAAMLVRAGLAD